MVSMYLACFYKEDHGYSVIFPDLNWLATQGDTTKEAMEMAVACLAGYLHGCKMDGAPIPEPSPMDSVDPEAIARELEVEPGEYFVNIVSVDVEAYAKVRAK